MSPNHFLPIEMGTSKIKVFDSLASDYDAWFEEEGRLIFASEVEALRKVLPLLTKPWIEVGVGSGRFAQALGVEIGLDSSSKLLEKARHRGVSVFLGRSEEMPFKNGVFGTIFFVVTPCFVDSQRRTLGEAARLLRSGGKVVLGMVSRDSPWGQLYRGEKQRGHRFYRHATFYDYDEVDMFLRQIGFSIEKVISTLFQSLGGVNHIELPRQGFSAAAGFTVILAGKTTA